jgi:hypothetical protein
MTNTTDFVKGYKLCDDTVLDEYFSLQDWKKRNQEELINAIKNAIVLLAQHGCLEFANLEIVGDHILEEDMSIRCAHYNAPRRGYQEVGSDPVHERPAFLTNKRISWI